MLQMVQSCHTWTKTPQENQQFKVSQFVHVITRVEGINLLQIEDGSETNNKKGKEKNQSSIRLEIIRTWNTSKSAASFTFKRRLRLTWPTILLQKPRPRSTTVHHTNWWSPLLQETPGETDTCFNSMAKSWRGGHTVDLLGCPSITAKSIRCTDSFFSPDVLVLVLTSCWRPHPFPWRLRLQR